MLIRRIRKIFGSLRGSGCRGSWVRLSLVVLIVSLLMLFESASVCGDTRPGVDKIKQWLQRGPKPTGATSSADKRAVESMLETLRLRQEDLNKREQELAEARKSLEQLGAQLKKQMASIKQIKASAEELLTKLEAKKQERIDSLVSLYGTMNAQNAASALLEVFKKDPSLVAALFQALNKKRAAIILDGITATSPEVAAEITMWVGKYR
ncbi:MAG TPA: hypothetical protein VM163_08680 [bacterium]|nr:hypothetical protein [bacterium]